MTLGSANSVTPSDLLGFTRFLTGTLENTSAFSDTNIIALLNLEYRSLQAMILSALNYDWKENTVDGTGTGLINLVADDQTYAFPTDIIQIDRIEINYTGETDGYAIATIRSMQGIDRPISNTTNTPNVKGSQANPLVWIRNNVLYLDPVPTSAVTSGMKVWGQTLITDLSTSSQEPVFADAFHKIIAYGAAHLWCSANDKGDKATTLERQELGLFDEMVDFYSTRQATTQPKMSARRRSMR